LASGTPKGKHVKIAELDSYVTSGSSAGSHERAVLYLTDVLGHTFINAQLLADYYAEHSHVTVYVPDLFEGKPIKREVITNPELRKTINFPEFIGLNSKEKRYPQVAAYIKELKEHHGVKKLASIGFCFGGWCSLQLSRDQLVDAAAVAHPSLVQFEEDIQNIRTPSLFLLAEVDEQFPQERIPRTKEILSEKSYPFVLKFFPQMVHGFAVRGDANEEPVRKAAEEAAEEAVSFFNKYLVV